jgi:cell division protein FtsB
LAQAAAGYGHRRNQRFNVKALEGSIAVLHRHRGRIAILMLVLVWGYFLIAFGEQAWRARQLQSDVDAQRASIATLSRENADLQAQADLYASEGYYDYVQAIARRDLNLANPGETVLLVRWQGEVEPAGATLDQPVLDDERKNWQRWLDAFTGN